MEKNRSSRNKSDLLEDIRHNLVSISGLKAFDGLSDTIKSTDSHVTVNISEIIPLDFKELIDEIDDVIDGDDSINAFVMDNLIEWSNLVTELSYKEIRLYESKKDYQVKSDKVLEDARNHLNETGEDIIKQTYGGNNDKTRKQYVKDKLSKDKQEITDLEFSIDYCKRRISYLKSLIHTKTVLMEVKKNE